MRRLFAVLVLLSIAGALALPSTSSGTHITNFDRESLSGLGVTFDRPTVVTFGPDGRLYVAEQEGRIRALSIDPSLNEITAVEQITAATDLQEVFGLAFDPTDASVPAPIYVTNTVSGVGDDGLGPLGEFPGRVTKIHGPGYNTITDIITGLPISRFTHQSNGLVFDSSGVLYIAQGSSTSAGIPHGSFSQEEVPLSAAVLVADISAPGFDGNVTYDPPNTYSTTVDQISGDVSEYATGLRNPFDLIIHSNGRMYITDNGPSLGSGPSSTSCTTEGPHVWGPDELNIVEAGAYYGSPNRNRGRFDPAECVYRNGTLGSGPEWTGPIAELPTSSNGIIEYTSAAAGGKLLGDLFYVSFGTGVIGHIVLSDDGSSVVLHEEFDAGFIGPLGLAMGPDGSLYIAEWSGSQIVTLQAPDPPGLGDTDGDGCSDQRENGLDETLGGQRHYLNPWDFYDVLGPGAALPVDQVIDLPNDILGVILHFSPQGAPPYDVQFDRGPATAAAGGGPNPWNMTAPDGVIDLPNDILGVILQFQHNCQ